jgi:serine protease Do
VTAERAREARLSDVHGVVVTGVSENGPAAGAGLAGGDIITDFRGQRVEGTLEMARMVRETPPGRTVRLSVWRDGSSREFSVQMGDAPARRDAIDDFTEALRERIERRLGNRDAMPPQAPGAARRAAVLGITAQDVSGQLGDYLKVPEGQGVLVTEVHAGSAAERAGLRAGDVIIFADGERVRRLPELQARLRSQTQPRTAVLRVIRDGAETTINVELPAPRQPASNPDASGRPTIPI